MTFPLTPALPFVDNVSTITAATLNAWRTYISQAGDFTGGGTYSLTAPLTIAAGSSAWTFENDVRFDATGSVAIGANVTMTVEDTGIIDVDPGGLISLIGTIGNLARLNVGSLGKITVNSAGLIEFESGSTLTINSGTVVNATLSSGTVTLTGSAFVHGAAATLTHADTSVETHADGSTDTYQSGSSLVTNSGVTVTFGSAVSLNGNVTQASGATYTQQGAHTRSGNSAVTNLRVTSLPSTTGTITASQADIWEVPVGLAGPVVITIASEAADFEFTIRQINPTTQAFQVDIHNHLGTFLCSFRVDAAAPAESFATVRFAMRAAVSRPHVLFVWDPTATSLSGYATNLVFTT
jgi:hypothetical protein